MRTVRSFLASAVVVSAVALVVLLTPRPGPSQALREDSPLFRVKVDLVVLNVAVTDRRGRYIRDLAPGDFRVFEDGIPQQIATFAEGNEAPRAVGDGAAAPGGPAGAPPSAPAATEAKLDGPVSPVDDTFVGTNVFVLFDTSNFMYRSFVYAEDAIADFIRGLDGADSVAVYGFSRNLTRHTGLTPERMEAIKALRLSVAGDETALYNCLLLTLRDAARVPGRKVVIVFSNGPDNASTVAPDDVGAIAEDEGIPVYVISTNELNKDPISSNVFRRLTARTGGKAYFAKTWQRQSEAFTSIKEELASSYTLTYYPQPNPNGGWRSITVDLMGDALKKHRIRTRSGYRPKL
jgi:Ca-activated chloride channel homolog